MMNRTGSMKMLWITMLAMISFLLAYPVISAAQEIEEDEGEKKDVLDKELDKYWAEKRQVKIIEKKKFQMNGRFEFTPYIGTIPNDDFLIYLSTGLRVDYYFAESFGIELAVTKPFGFDSELQSFLKDNLGAQVRLPQKQELYSNLNFVWSPFYGKLSFMGLKLAHFDLNIVLGAGMVWLKVLPTGKVNRENKIRVAGNVGAGFKFFITDWFGIRIDYRQYFFQKFTGGVAYPAEISLGFSFLTPGKK